MMKTPPPNSSDSLSRREALAYALMFGSGLATALAPGAAIAQSAAEGAGGAITKETIAQAERISGLKFTDEERQSMLGPLKRRVDYYGILRELRIPNSVPPAVHFQVSANGPPPVGGPSADSDQGLALPSAIRPDSDNDLAQLSLAELAALIKDRRVSPVELTELYIERLKTLGAKLNCVVHVRADAARLEADRAEAEISAGNWRGPLHGIPWGAKDLFAAKGTRTTWGAMPYRDQVIDEDAAVVARLGEAGAILVAKLSLGALAQGDVWFNGRTLNPWNTKYGASGSSAGPGSATAAGLVGFSIGTETNGSIVMPSTICGVSGLRPTFGRVSRHGAMMLSPSMDKVGPMCRSAQDCAIVFEAIHGRDQRDPSTVTRPFDWPIGLTDLAGLRIGYLKGDFERVPNAGERKLNDAAFAKLEALGAKLLPVELPDFPVDPLRIILTVEAAAAFDELTLNNRDDELSQQHSLAWPNTFRTARLTPAVEYVQAQRARTLLMQAMDEFFAEIDFYIAPPMTGKNMLITNLTGHPAAVVPTGFVNGLPRAMCFMGRPFDESLILAVAHLYQSNTRWHRQHPLLEMG